MNTEKASTSITSHVDRAIGICTQEVANFIAYIESVDPELKRHEAIMVAAKVLNQILSDFANNPEMLADLKIEFQIIKGRRQ